MNPVERYPSPLRYPGGKTSLKVFLSETVRINGLNECTYIEPFAGGAGAGLALLFSERVSEIYINDKDPCIVAFWRAILSHSDEFLKLISKTPLSVQVWRRQKSILRHRHKHSMLKVGFATFYINRCNRSGVLNAGPIGGINQDGDYKIDARFNKEGLKSKIEKIALYKNRIRVWNQDAVTFLKRVFKSSRLDKEKSLVYMDPPYFEKAKRLYPLYLKEADHRRLAQYLNQKADFRWIVSYDDTEPVRKLYSQTSNSFTKKYSVHSARIGRELLISSPNCELPVSFLEAHASSD